MTITATVLIPAKTAESAQTTQYTSTNASTIIDKFTATNFSASNATVSVNLVTLGDTAGDQNLIVKTITLGPAECYTFPELVGHTLLSGGYISTLVSAASSVNIRASGRTIT